jgi:hypothetical protein
VTIKKAGEIVSFLILLTGFHGSCHAQSLNYAEIFDGDWQKALTFIEENNSWLKPALASHNIPWNEAVAIVFPELVRYSALLDKMEITMLKTLYRNLGEEYANFSIGVFQVKPSFAEDIQTRVFSGTDKELKSLFRKKSTFPDKRSYRASVIADLENPQTELNYIIAFYKICNKRFKDSWSDNVSKVRFLATAYNTGFLKNARDVESMYNKKFFNTKLFKTENYSYADVALYWFNNYSLNDH